MEHVPKTVDELCLLYHHALDQQPVPALVVVACLVFDFLCFQPFRDGPGWVSRLFTVLARYRHGIEVGYTGGETEEEKQESRCRVGRVFETHRGPLRRRLSRLFEGTLSYRQIALRPAMVGT